MPREGARCCSFSAVVRCSNDESLCLFFLLLYHSSDLKFTFYLVFRFALNLLIANHAVNVYELDCACTIITTVNV